LINLENMSGVIDAPSGADIYNYLGALTLDDSTVGVIGPDLYPGHPSAGRVAAPGTRPSRRRDAATGQARLQLENLGGVDGLAFAPSGEALAVCSNGRQIALYSLALREPGTGERRRIEELLVKLDDDSYEVRGAAGEQLLRMEFVIEPALRRAMKESKSAEVRIRSRRLRRELLTKPQARLAGHTAVVEAVAFSSDGKLLVSASHDGTARVWDVATRKERGRLVPAEAVRKAGEDARKETRGEDRPSPCMRLARTPAPASCGACGVPFGDITALLGAGWFAYQPAPQALQPARQALRAQLAQFRKEQAAAPRTPERPTFVVGRSGKGALPTLNEALQRARLKRGQGARIVVQDDLAEEEVRVIDLPNVSIEADEGRTITWRPRPGDPLKKLLTVTNAEGFRLKGFTLDGNGRAEALITLSLRCPGVVLEGLTLTDFTHYGVWVTNCEGGPGDKQVSLHHLNFVTTGADQTALFFDVLKNIPGIVKDRHFSVSDFSFEGPGAKVKTPNPDFLEDVKLPPGVKPVQG
jgi:hypothetical protein